MSHATRMRAWWSLQIAPKSANIGVLYDLPLPAVTCQVRVRPFRQFQLAPTKNLTNACTCKRTCATPALVSRVARLGEPVDETPAPIFVSLQMLPCVDSLRRASPACSGTFRGGCEGHAQRLSKQWLMRPYPPSWHQIAAMFSTFTSATVHTERRSCQNPS